MKQHQSQAAAAHRTRRQEQIRRVQELQRARAEKRRPINYRKVTGDR